MIDIKKAIQIIVKGHKNHTVMWGFDGEYHYLTDTGLLLKAKLTSAQKGLIYAIFGQEPTKGQIRTLINTGEVHDKSSLSRVTDLFIDYDSCDTAHLTNLYYKSDSAELCIVSTGTEYICISRKFADLAKFNEGIRIHYGRTAVQFSYSDGSSDTALVVARWREVSHITSLLKPPDIIAD